MLLTLQRRITDFGADVSFGKISNKLMEHYGITVPESSAQNITEKHAKTIKEEECLETEVSELDGVDYLIAGMDGTMVPIVDTFDKTDNEKPVDKRKTRKVRWKEARLTLSHPKDTVNPIFGSTLGEPEEAGKHLFNCAARSGMGQKTKVHCFGDGAPWIANQVEKVFGVQGKYLIDFYHLCEYLAAASKRCAPNNPSTWTKQQKQRMKENREFEVMEALQPYREAKEVPDKDAPVKCCYRYIKNRPGQFDYKGALEKDLPIGSGEVESAHRYVIQERLKIAGAWWKEDNAQNMLALRTLRINNGWEKYWEENEEKVA